jgi:hypothetical protein
MVATTIYIAIVIGILLRIIATDGYIAKPTFINGKLQLNIVGTIIFGIVGAALAAYFGLPGFETFGGALVTAYSVPYAIDKIVTKSPIGNVSQDEQPPSDDVIEPATPETPGVPTEEPTQDNEV